MSAYELILFFCISLVSGIIALICWLLELIFNKLHLNAISEILGILKQAAILASVLFGGFTILFLSLSGIAFIVKYIADFIFALF